MVFWTPRMAHWGLLWVRVQGVSLYETGGLQGCQECQYFCRYEKRLTPDGSARYRWRSVQLVELARWLIAWQCLGIRFVGQIQNEMDVLAVYTYARSSLLPSCRVLTFNGVIVVSWKNFWRFPEFSHSVPGVAYLLRLVGILRPKLSRDMFYIWGHLCFDRGMWNIQ